MVDIEAHKETDEMRRMHPLWEQYELPSDNGSGAPRYFYFNPYNGKNGIALLVVMILNN